MTELADTVTGTQVSVALLVDLPADRLWELVTDVGRYGEWSPECVGTEWLADAGGRPPRLGDRFVGHNRLGPPGDLVESSVVCVVTHATAPRSFGYAVLDGHGRPASLWRFELTPADRPDQTRLWHGFEHGPGETWGRLRAADAPAEWAQRLVQLRRNMTTTLAAMLAGVSHREVRTA
ncbi:SRPBCC family protein [Actinophytocola xanthii]|uniref:Polyketide cyclase n=1 Tax=Actinophytocola xanthii TaxID=1912961 RepID=A0A1Q8CNQ2_9PSEU|nr:SRPBCC family protein [Actinophytocola xanthii]OLF15992.1 hypothetical protein BU204_19020 [Actinophytocola xanthii]